eukprot:1157640-Pelagomonas_calceolata.AAC.8
MCVNTYGFGKPYKYADSLVLAQEHPYPSPLPLPSRALLLCCPTAPHALSHFPQSAGAQKRIPTQILCHCQAKHCFPTSLLPPHALSHFPQSAGAQKRILTPILRHCQAKHCFPTSPLPPYTLLHSPQSATAQKHILTSGSTTAKPHTAGPSAPLPLMHCCTALYQRPLKSTSIPEASATVMSRIASPLPPAHCRTALNQQVHHHLLRPALLLGLGAAAGRSPIRGRQGGGEGSGGFAKQRA